MGLAPEISNAGKRTSLPLTGQMTKVESFIVPASVAGSVIFLSGKKSSFLKRRKKNLKNVVT
jgi:hypothetical protein